MRMSWKLLKTTFWTQWILVSKISLLALRNRISLSLTRPFQAWISLKLIRQKILLSIRLSKDWQWKWMTFSSFKITSNPLDVYQLRLSLRFWILTGLTTVVTRLSKLSWKTSTSQLLNLKNNCKRLMTSILPCVMSWDVQKNLKPWWIWRLFLVAMSVLMVVWMTWKCLMKSMLAQLKLKWMSMVWKNHGFSCSRMKPTTTQLRSNHLVERLLVSVVPFVTHCQVVHTFTKPCVSQVLVILQHQLLKLVLVNCHNKWFLKQRLTVILHTVTKLVLQQLTFVNTSTQVSLLSVWS